MKLGLYAIAMCAKDDKGNVHLRARAILAHGVSEAEDRATELCGKKFPAEYGWREHDIAITMINKKSIIKAALTK